MKKQSITKGGKRNRDMDTRELIKLARSRGITIKALSEMTNISVRTLYNFNCGSRNLSKEKEEKVQAILSFLIDI